ncbi:MAG: hypothetical protein Q8O91_05075 [Candidatus Aminicenantes bacterium]|nr:hypothetical protein [Candidatus Aminicenantes bacterium]
MNVIQCAVKGIRESTVRPKMIVLLWSFNLLVAGLCYFVFLRAFGGAVGTSALVKEMVHKADMNVVVEFLTSASGGAVTELFVIVIGLSVLYALVSVFLYGGILQILIQKGGRWRFAETFFAGGGRFYGRFFRLEIYSLGLWLTAGLIFILINALINFNFRDSTNEQTTFVFTIIKILFAFFLVFLIKMIMDYARILIAGRDSRDVFRSLLEAVRFVLKKPAKTLALYYLLGLAGWASFLLYKVLDSAVPQTSTVTIAIGFLLAQVFIASRGWLKIAYQAAQGRVIGLI